MLGWVSRRNRLFCSTLKSLETWKILVRELNNKGTLLHELCVAYYRGLWPKNELNTVHSLNLQPYNGEGRGFKTASQAGAGLATDCAQGFALVIKINKIVI